jgi:uncharacterized protein (DUF952 family)
MPHTWAVLIYKILLPDEWAQFEQAGTFDGSPFDDSSGFVHCSSGEQVAATALRHFVDAGELVVVALDTSELGETVRWEHSFPHVYGPLPSSAVVEIRRFADARHLESER